MTLSWPTAIFKSLLGVPCPISERLASQEAPDFIGAPEEIRTPDPQIRSLVHLLFEVSKTGDWIWRKIGEIEIAFPSIGYNYLILLALPRGDGADQKKSLKHLPIYACLLDQ
jgi:hypothetical protein